MSYETRLEGTLELDPALSEEKLAALAEALLRVGDPRAGWLVASREGVTSKDATDWEAALALIERVRETTLVSLGLEVRGTLVALGEDDQVLARVSFNGARVKVQHEESPAVDEERAVWLRTLRSPKSELRKAAVQQLAGWGDREVLEAIAAAAASDRELSVRTAALETLGGLGKEAAPVLSTIAACLNDAQPFVRYWATYALGRIGAAAKDTLPALEAMSADREDGPRYGAADAIRRIRADLQKNAVP